MRTEAKKKIEELLEFIVPSEIEEEKKLPLRESAIIPLQKKFEKALNIHYTDQPKYLKTIPEVISPEEINAFLQTTILYEQEPNYYLSAGRFISRLIHNSYRAGYQQFTLDTRNLKPWIYTLGEDLTAQNDLFITINGKAGNELGKNSRRVHFILKGHVGNSLGIDAGYCTFVLEQRASSFAATYCIFKTANPLVLGDMFNEVDSSNRIYYIHPDGTEQLVRNREHTR